MTVHKHFILFNHALGLLAAGCLLTAGMIPASAGMVLAPTLGLLAWLEWKGVLPLKPPSWFSLAGFSMILLPLVYFILHPEIPVLISGFLVFVLVTRFLFKTELNDYLYGHLIAIVCLLIGALFIQDLAFAFLFLSFYLVLCWALIFYNLMVERVGSHSPPERFRLAGRGEKVEGSLFGLTGSLVVLSLALTSLIFLSFPRMGLGFLALNSGTSALSGFSDQVRLGEVGAIKLNQQMVMRVQFTRNGKPYRPKGPILWRGVALDHYDGQVWKTTLPQSWTARHRPGRPLSLFQVTPPGNPVLQEVYMEAIDTPVFFTWGLPIQVDGTFRGLAMDHSYTLKTTDLPMGPRRFEILADVEVSGAAYEWPVPYMTKGLRRRFLQLPPVSARMRQLAHDLTAPYKTPEQKAAAILNHFRKNFGYSLDMKRETGLSALDEFLFVRRTGHCEYFASAMVMLLRLARVPARIVNGFMGVEWNDMGNYMMVRQAHAHSWVEAFTRGKGWKVFDPTPAAPPGEMPTQSRLFLTMDMMRLYWQRYVVKYNFQDQVRLARFFSRQGGLLRDGWDSLRNWRPESLLSGIKSDPLTSALGALGLVGLILGFWRYRDQLRWAGSRLPPAAVGYRRMLTRLDRTGMGKDPRWTHREFLDHIHALPPEKKQAVRGLTRLYEKSRFRGDPLTSQEQRDMSALLRQI
ncbi:MAG: DUF3488 and DUF4129 domain-containing transglutaminase family protein [Nitrospinaceae bacterium]